MAKPGCGSILAFVLIALILLLIGSNEAVGYYFKHCGTGDVLDCFLHAQDGDEETEEESEETVTATGVYEYKGYAVTVTANIPLGGGAVTGTVSGTCDGKVRGTYDGVSAGPVNGSMTAACSPFFVNIPASAEFFGSVQKGSKTVPVRFNGRGGGFEHSGEMTLTYQ